MPQRHDRLHPDSVVPNLWARRWFVVSTIFVVQTETPGPGKMEWNNGRRRGGHGALIACDDRSVVRDTLSRDYSTTTYHTCRTAGGRSSRPSPDGDEMSLPHSPTSSVRRTQSLGRDWGTEYGRRKRCTRSHCKKSVGEEPTLQRLGGSLRSRKNGKL